LRLRFAAGALGLCVRVGSIATSIPSWDTPKSESSTASKPNEVRARHTSFGVGGATLSTQEMAAAELDGAKAARFWLPWIAAYTRARFMEIVRLRREDRRHGEEAGRSTSAT
jgi:hypothetical protein